MIKILKLDIMKLNKNGIKDNFCMLTIFLCILIFTISCGKDKKNNGDSKPQNNFSKNVYTNFFEIPKDSILTNIINDSISCVAKPYFKYLKNGAPGREIELVFKENKHSGKAQINLVSRKSKRTVNLILEKGIDTYSLLLDEGISVDQDDKVDISISIDGNTISKMVTIPKKRQWTVYLYPHSHIDIGYTNTQENCEIIHSRNLVEGIKLGEKTAHYPEGSKYLWNSEGLWPFERSLGKASPEEKEKLIEGVKKGYLRLDAGYANILSSDANGEELIEYLNYSRKYEKLTGKPIETLVQVDVPGMTWGMLPVASKMGIKYCLSFNNGYDRVGRSTLHSFKPFWWADRNGKNKMLFLQAGSYNPGALIKGKNFWPAMLGQTDPNKLPIIIKTDKPRKNFVEPYINKVLPELEKSDFYPYDIFVMSWAMADNTPIDADLPDAVKSWNEEYAFPRLVIASSTDILKDFEKKYGDELPELRGDFTEYWTDGLGTAAKQTAMNRTGKERLLQAETLWTMLRTTTPANREKFDEAWRNTIMGTEHTWCYAIPDQQPISDEILQIKFSRFEKMETLTNELVASALEPVSQKDSETIGVFNTLSWKRSSVVRLSEAMSKGFTGVTDMNGNEILSQKLSTGELLFYANDIPAFGSKKYSLVHANSSLEGTMVIDNVLNNGIIKVTIDKITGDISSIIRDGKEFVKQGNGFSVNNYKYLKGSDSPDKALGTSNAKYTVKENGPLVVTVVIESDAAGANKLIREITITRNDPHVLINNKLDKIGIVDKEGVHFGFAFDMENPKMVADIPWGKIEINKDQLLGANRNWIAVKRWVDISEGNKGLVWTSLDVPLIEVGDIRANIIGAATGSDEWVHKLDTNGVMYSWVMNNHWHTNFQLSQEGMHSFKYSILPYNTTSNIVLANRFGNEQFQPLIVESIDENATLKQLLSIEGNPLVFSTVLKASEDGKSTLIRLRSLSENEEVVSLNWKSIKPSAIFYYNMKDGSQVGKLEGKVVVPALDFITLEVIF